MRRRKILFVFAVTGALAVALLPSSATARSESPSADLQVSIVDAPDPVRYVDASRFDLGPEYTYTITVTNAGPDPAAGTTADFVIGNPGAVRDIYGHPNPFLQGIYRDPGSFTTTQGTCAFEGLMLFGASGLHCDLGSLATGATATVTVTVKAARFPPLDPGASETVTNSASVSSDMADPGMSNNSASETTTVVQGYADLAVDIAQAPSPASTADDLDFTISVRNYGPDAPRPFLTFTYPESDAFTSVEGPAQCATTDPTSVFCLFGPLASGETTTVTVRVTPEDSGGRTYSAVVGTGCSGGHFCTFAAFALNPTPDPNPANNSVQIDEPPPPPPHPPPAPPPGPPAVACVVPKVVGTRLATAKRLIADAHCSTGKIKRKYSRFHRGRVLEQSPRPGRKLAKDTRVGLVVSKGPRPHPKRQSPRE